MVIGRESWIPDEVAMAGRENLDAAHVARYDAKEDAEGFTEAERLRPRLPVGPCVVDLGAGTGQFTMAASRWAARVVAVDVSPIMLERLRTKINESGASNIECVEAGFLTYDHQGVIADLVYSRYALHHLPDFWKAVALTRVAGILRPGGLFRLWDVVYSFEPSEASPVLERWFSGSSGTSIDAEWLRDELEEHVRDEHSTFSWLLEPMLERSGLRIIERRYSSDEVTAQYLCQRPT